MARNAQIGEATKLDEKTNVGYHGAKSHAEDSRQAPAPDSRHDFGGLERFGGSPCDS
jgi:hypothetical protein